MAKKQPSLAELVRSEYGTREPKYSVKKAVPNTPVKGKRDLGVKLSRPAEISVPRPMAIDRLYNALDKYAPGPGLGTAIKGPLEATLGPSEMWNALVRGGRQAIYGDAYRDAPELRSEDALNLGLLGGIELAAKPLAKVGKRVLNSRLGQYMREGRPLADAADSALEGAFTVRPGAAPAAAPQQPRLTTSYAVPRRVEGPAPRQALPAPGPGLPAYAAKPRGGQFYPDTELGPKNAQVAGYRLENYTDRNGVDRYAIVTPEGAQLQYLASTPENGWELANAHLKTNMNVSSANKSPEAAAREARENYGLIQYNEVGDPEPQAQLGDWLEKALAKYYKTDFGSPNDPLRELAARGMHYDPAMTPELWQREVNDSLMEDPIGYFTVPRHESSIRAELAGGPRDFSFLGAHDPVAQGALMQAAPWLRKQPVTENLYGIRDALDLGHFSDEMTNALRGPEAGIPLELAVRPESLDRMSFAQAAEHVGKINQWRAKEMERAALSNLDSPAVQTFKEYTENNPRGLRWVELRAPDAETMFNLRPVEENGNSFWHATDPDTGEVFPLGGTKEQALASLRYQSRDPLQQVLKYEGDTMGHCVGGYCDDVLSGRSRIFSLRDAKGEPHVTIETSPRSLTSVPDGQYDEYRARGFADLGLPYDEDDTPQEVWDRVEQIIADERKANPVLEDIIQIKGKQNRAPNDEYLPFVQDFVKSGRWGNVGDIENTSLVRLPDGRYITKKQWAEGVAAIENPWRDPSQYDERYLDRLSTAEWESMAPYFKGYAIGGKVDADRCFCRHPMAVKR